MNIGGTQQDKMKFLKRSNGNTFKGICEDKAPLLSNTLFTALLSR
jgi:hypothetical protein